MTHMGLVREENEDAALMLDEVGFWAVVDGMGGHEEGRWAAATLVSAMTSLHPAGDFEADCRQVVDTIGTANQAVLRGAKARNTISGATMVALLLQGRRFACFWAGDSRLYRLRNDELAQISHDQTQVQQLVDAGLLTAAEARVHPRAHLVLNAVGVRSRLKVETVTGEARPADRFLLCSDGLTDVVADSEIACELGASEPREAARRLVDLTLERGAPDNVTVIVVACEVGVDLR